MERRIEKNAEAACQLGTFLKQELKLTEKQIRQAKFREMGILVNGERCRVTEKLKAGDRVSVLIEEHAEQKMVASEGRPDILYEDEDLLVLNKPAGIVVHPSHGHYGDSILNLMAGYYEERGENVKLRVVGRLDKDTSGVLVLAKNQIAAARLAEQKAQGDFEKIYLAIPSRMPVKQKGTITKKIRKDPSHLNKMMTEENGGSETSGETALDAVTHYEVLKEKGMLRVWIETGRTHQIRVHLSSIGAPLEGDMLYGGVDSRMTRAALHAEKVSFIHPFRGEKMTITAELPSDFVEFLRTGKNTFDKQEHSVYNNDYIKAQNETESGVP